MAPELSSNWKKLQPKIEAESSSSSSRPSKRKATAEAEVAVAAVIAKLLQTKKKKTEDAKEPLSSSAPRTHEHPAIATADPLKPTKKMGVTQSSVVTKGTRTTVTPSTALWAEDNDITPEDLAEAYGLGLSKPATSTPASSILQAPTRENEGLAPGVVVGKYIAVDCEMVGVGACGDALARVSIVDFHGAQVYDSYVLPAAGERVSNYRTAITGITAQSLRAKGRAFDAVQAEVADLLRGRVLVGHDLKHDLAALRLRHPRGLTRDTVLHEGFRGQPGQQGRYPSLRNLARELLGLEIHGAVHSSVEDARVAMLLFRHHKAEFDAAYLARYQPKPGAKGPKRTKKSKNKKK
ncbi:ribonuclease H-like domain-containing protein [Camillea tinctor]|nr:ribonuclease H-like domain-containing protein [Camillea tinctor]